MPITENRTSGIIDADNKINSIKMAAKNVNVNTRNAVHVKTENDKNLKGNEKGMEGEEHRTALQKFYHGKNVLITGATGFLGKLLVEKILRCCPGVNSLYLLVRKKKGKDVYTRIEEIFDDVVFDRLKETCPKFRHKIAAVPGDCSAAGLGLALADRRLLVEKIHVVFHAAATVKFDEEIRTALATNVLAPLHLMRLAEDMKCLQAIVHVSTAYSNCHLGNIQERIYECPVNLADLERLVDKSDDDELEQILPSILGPWPNTYTFTKALAETEIKKICAGVPLAIFRPAIVTSTATEPLPGWIDNMYGPTGVVAGAATGVLRTLQCDERVTADIVPADSVVNCLLAAAEKTSRVRASRAEPRAEPPVYNYVSSVENRITWGDFMELNCTYGFTHPLSCAMWYICITLNKSPFRNWLYKIFLHIIPALLMDGFYLCFGRKPKLLKVYRKIHKFSSVLTYFCTNEIKFSNRNVRELWEQTTADDKRLFPFSMRDISWPVYFGGYIRGIRTHLFQETEDTLQQARVRWNRLYYVHLFMRSMFTCTCIYVLRCFVEFVYRMTIMPE